MGEQRKKVFIQAASLLAPQLQSAASIVIDASFTALSCDAFSAILGAAGATNYRGYADPPDPDVEAFMFYPNALLNALMEGDQFPLESDIIVIINENIGTPGCLQFSTGWYYGFDSGPTYSVNFLSLLLHELIHGLGFVSLVDLTTGAKPYGYDDVYSANLYDQNLGSWPALTNAQRRASATSGTELLWSGQGVNSQADELTSGFYDGNGNSVFDKDDKVQMYAPSPVQEVSSISHFNTSLSPDELMEPYYSGGTDNIGLGLYVLKDIGWQVHVDADNNIPLIDFSSLPTASIAEDSYYTVDLNLYSSDSDGDSLSYIVTGPDNYCSYEIVEALLTITPVADYFGSCLQTIEVYDGSDFSDASFTLHITAVNDRPSFPLLTNQSTLMNTPITIFLNANSGSVFESDVLSYSLVSVENGADDTSPALIGSTLTLTPDSGFLGSVSVVIEVNDGAVINNTAQFSFELAVHTPITLTTSSVAYTGNSSIPSTGEALIFRLAGGSTQYTLTVMFNGENRADLLTTDGLSFTLLMPTSGAFAGTYTLTVSDVGFTGYNTQFDIIRLPRVTNSMDQFIFDDNQQTLTVEGALAGDAFDLVQLTGACDGSCVSFLDSPTGNLVTQAIATDDASNFNRATVYIQPKATTSEQTFSLKTSNVAYEDVVLSDLKLTPLISYPLHVAESVNLTPLANVTIQASAVSTESATLLTNWSATTQFITDENGDATVILPDIGDYEVLLTLAGYFTNTLNLADNQLTSSATMTVNPDARTFTGTITASAPIDFIEEAPVVILSNTAGEVFTATITVIDSHSASYVVSMEDSSSLPLTLIFTHSLANTVTTVTQAPQWKNVVDAVLSSPAESSSGGSLGGWGTAEIGLIAWILLILLARQYTRKNYYD